MQRHYAVLIAVTLLLVLTQAGSAAAILAPGSVSQESAAAVGSAAWNPTFAAPATAASFADLGTNPRPFGIAAGDFTGDGKVDLVMGLALGQIFFARGSGDGAFMPKVQFAWKQAALNSWALAAGDVNLDGKLDLIWGATAASSGCSRPGVAPASCIAAGGTIVRVNDGDVRAFLGNGDGTFAQNPYYVSVLHNGGILLARAGVDAASLTAGDVDGDRDVDLVVARSKGPRPSSSCCATTAGPSRSRRSSA